LNILVQVHSIVSQNPKTPHKFSPNLFKIK